MSDYTVARIAGKLQEQFGKAIDLSDAAGRPPDQQKDQLCSRALAALCVKHISKVSDDLAASSVTDGYQDQGIDALYFDRVNNLLILVTSKWIKDGKKGIDQEDILKFIEGIKLILTPDLSSFNGKVRSKEPEIASALRDASVQLLLVTAYTGSQAISPNSNRPMLEFLTKLNENAEMARHEVYNLPAIWQVLASAAGQISTDLDVYLRHWGRISEPFVAYYGFVHSDEIAQWWNKYNGQLCHHNLRQFMRRSDVNQAIEETFRKEPQHFWYFNNGITVICDRAEPTLAGGGEKRIGLFRLTKAHIVNGAQTMGVIGSTALPPGSDDGSFREDRGAGAWVQIRIIPLEGVPEGFDAKITRATNFQNAVTPRDFAALDELQQRIAMDFAFDRRKYAFKSGEEEPQGDDGCGIEEVTRALACADADVGLGVQAKTYISGIWLNERLYRRLFNHSLSAKKIWNAVSVMRSSAAKMELLRRGSFPRAELIAAHMRFIIFHLVLQDPRIDIADMKADTSRLARLAEIDTESVFGQLADYIEAAHPRDYLANLSKNATKCRALVKKVDWKYPAEGETNAYQRTFFDNDSN